MSTTLLLVDDEEHLRSMLSAALKYNGYHVVAAADGAEALSAMDVHRPAAVVLDVMLPDIDGFELCSTLRARGDNTPVVFLTAVDSTADTVKGLTLGGDDYLAKPFSLEELVARIDAVLRRSAGAPHPGLRCGTIELDELRHEVRVAGEMVELAPTEFNLLQFLLEHVDQVLSKPQILEHVWGFDFAGSIGIVETYIGYLRRKVDVGEDKVIHTVRGVGYVMRTPGSTR